MDSSNSQVNMVEILLINVVMKVIKEIILMKVLVIDITNMVRNNIKDLKGDLEKKDDFKIVY